MPSHVTWCYVRWRFSALRTEGPKPLHSSKGIRWVCKGRCCNTFRWLSDWKLGCCFFSTDFGAASKSIDFGERPRKQSASSAEVPGPRIKQPGFPSRHLRSYRKTLVNICIQTHIDEAHAGSCSVLKEVTQNQVKRKLSYNCGLFDCSWGKDVKARNASLFHCTVAFSASTADFWGNSHWSPETEPGAETSGTLWFGFSKRVYVCIKSLIIQWVKKKRSQQDTGDL